MIHKPPAGPGGHGGLINLQTGELQDFIPRPGDQPVSQVRSSKADRWGARVLVSNVASFNARGVRKIATLIDTGDMGRSRTVNVQLRFSTNIVNPGGLDSPVIPFLYPLPLSVSRIQVRVRRGVDPLSSPTTDIYDMAPNDVLPVDNITARFVSVEVEPTSSALDATVWVEAIATPVSDIGARNEVHPWAVAQNPTFIATNAAAVSLLPPNSDRVQFFIVNTSTDADLIIQLGRGPNNALPQWLPTPLGTFVLPRGMFSVYESPAPRGFKGIPGDGVRGSVYGIWSNAGTGGAMIHEGTAF